MISKNKIKFIHALKQKKARTETGLFIAEGDKIITEILVDGNIPVSDLIATPEWLQQNRYILHKGIREITEVTEAEFRKVTSFETPSGVMAVMALPAWEYNTKEIAGTLSVCLDTIQDPGNLGTIIRTADWFGIRHVFCSPGCADCYNPKVVQASMGAVLRIQVHEVSLEELLEETRQFENYSVYGSYLEGTSIYRASLSSEGMLVFGNESKGIHSALRTLIHYPLTIPSFSGSSKHVESLNVSAAVAVFCSEFMRRKSL
jgi:RNA methyltransferase, TrmH family